MNTEDKQERRYWGFDDTEKLSCDSPDEFIQDALENGCMTSAEIQSMVDENEEWVICEYKPAVLNLKHFHTGGPLESLLVGLDEEYGDPEGDYIKPTKVMLAIEDKFIAEIMALYEPWSCEMTGEKISVNMAKWIRDNEYEYGD